MKNKNKSDKLFLNLRGEIVSKGYNLKTLSKELGITQQALNEKIHGRKEFTLREIIVTCNLLLAPVDIFFEPKLHNLQFLKICS